MNAKKKILAVALAASMAVLAVGGSSLAYFTDTDHADNTFTVGNVDIKLTEPNWTKDDHKDVYPGEPLAKDPTVTNIGDNPAVIRVKVTKPDYVHTRVGNSDAGLDKVNADWKQVGDYYYYTKVLATDQVADTALDNEKTTALFDYIVLDKGVKSDFGGATQSVKIDVEAVQAQGIMPSYSQLVPGYQDGNFTIADEAWDEVYAMFDNAF